MRARVKVGHLYTYNATGLDLISPKVSIPNGTIVRVGNLPGAPKANTMGQCYVFHPDTGDFIGMVSTASLTYHVHQPAEGRNLPGFSQGS